MGSEIVEIQPKELRFTFELKKQSSCLVRLSNKSDEYVAFKVKTTSPKRYCVRPNTGVIRPQSTCDFTVTMQAQRTAPPDMQLKDKFLVQSTVVPFGSTDEDITSTLFSKESGRSIEECKLRVFLVSPPHSPILQPFNGTLKQEVTNGSPVLKPAFVHKVSPIVIESSSFEDAFFDDKNLQPTHAKEIEDLKSKIATMEYKLSEAKDVEDLRLQAKDVEHLRLQTKDVEDLRLQLQTKDVEDLRLQAKDAEDLRSKIDILQSKLSEAEKMIAILSDEKTLSIREREKSHQEMIHLRRKAASKVQAGFPTFFVVFIWIVGITIGYLLRL